MRLIDADKLEVDMEETVFCGDGTYKIFGYSKKQIDSAPAVTPEPNPPLTLEELREIFGEPVFLTGGRGWRICYGVSDFGEEGPYMEVGYGVRVPLFDYGKTWLAYRRKLEEGTRGGAA